MSGSAAILHARLACALGLLVAGAFTLLPAPSRSAQLLAATLLIGVLGMPHGALDVGLGARVLRPHLGRRWAPAFVSLYLGLALLVVLAWWARPALALSLFLGVSLLHFGAGDRRALPGSRAPAAETLLRGSLPVVAPLLFRPEESAALLGLLLPAEQAPLGPTLVDVASRLAPAYAGLLGLAVVGLCAGLLRDSRRRGIPVALEIGVLGFARL